MVRGGKTGKEEANGRNELLKGCEEKQKRVRGSMVG